MPGEYVVDNSIKGSLLSGLIFPGLGQIVLKHYTRGFVLMFTVLAVVMVIAIKAVSDALAVLEVIESKGGIIDVKTISESAAQVISTSGSAVYKVGILLMAACWIFGIIDAYRIGKKMDRTLNNGGIQESWL